jgi:hypothetical protein
VHVLLSVDSTAKLLGSRGARLNSCWPGPAITIAARDAELSTIQQAEWVRVHGRRSFFSPCVIDRARDMIPQITVFPRWLRKIRALGSPELSIHLGPTSASTRPSSQSRIGPRNAKLQYLH